MGYFPNGTSGEIYEAQFCARCVHWTHDKASGTWGCPVMDAHALHNYEQQENPGLKSVLDRLIPQHATGNLKCRMFLTVEEVKRVRRERADPKQGALPLATDEKGKQ